MGNQAEEIFDYTAITVQVIEEIASRAINHAERLRSEVLDAGSPRTYGNTLAPLEAVEEVLSRAFGEAGFMGYVHTDPRCEGSGARMFGEDLQVAHRPGLRPGALSGSGGVSVHRGGREALRRTRPLP